MIKSLRIKHLVRAFYLDGDQIPKKGF